MTYHHPDSAPELRPLKLSMMQGSGVYFHDIESDMLYQLKNAMQQLRCNYIGLSQTLEVGEDDLVEKGTLKQLREKNPIITIISLKNCTNKTIIVHNNAHL